MASKLTRSWLLSLFGRAGAAAYRCAAGLLSILSLLISLAQPAAASLTDNNYDGNIYSLYAGNGSLVPPRNTLAETLTAGRPALLIFYLDDDAASKQFSPVVSELQRLWGNTIELIPLVTDPLQDRGDRGVGDPAHYWSGRIPQVVVLDGAGKVLLDQEGQVGIDQINAAVSKATGIALPEELSSSSTMSFNELNSELVNH